MFLTGFYLSSADFVSARARRQFQRIEFPPMNAHQSMGFRFAAGTTNANTEVDDTVHRNAGSLNIQSLPSRPRAFPTSTPQFGGSSMNNQTGIGGSLNNQVVVPRSTIDSMLADNTRERLRIHTIHSTGKLQLRQDVVYDFTSEDLQDLGEIGRGGFGTVNKMVHIISDTVMAVKRIRSTVDEKEQKQLMDLEVVMKSNECPCIVQFYGALFKEVHFHFLNLSSPELGPSWYLLLMDALLPR